MSTVLNNKSIYHSQRLTEVQCNDKWHKKQGQAKSIKTDIKRGTGQKYQDSHKTGTGQNQNNPKNINRIKHVYQLN